MIQMYYVATRILFVLVEAESEAEARRIGGAALGDLYQERLRRRVTVDIKTVRLATDDEIALQRHHRKERSRERMTVTAQFLSSMGGALTKKIV